MSADHLFFPPRWSRRRVLALGAGTAAGVLLTACGGGESSSSGSISGDPSSAGASDPAPDGGFTVVQRYPSSKSLTPGVVRLPISLATDDGGLITAGPATLTGVIRDEAGDEVAAISVPRRGEGLSVPYWSVTATIPERGLYEMAIDGATGDPTPFLIFDADEIAFPAVSTPLPPFDTPTTSDARGVDPICTRLDGPCPFHDVTLTEALALGKPVVYLIGTPAHCATATCGPGLEFLIDAASEYADRATFVHAEVYADPEATKLAPAVTSIGIDYEPIIWITDASGTVVRRIDTVWDADELSVLLEQSLT